MTVPVGAAAARHGRLKKQTSKNGTDTHKTDGIDPRSSELVKPDSNFLSGALSRRFTDVYPFKNDNDERDVTYAAFDEQEDAEPKEGYDHHLESNEAESRNDPSTLNAGVGLEYVHIGDPGGGPQRHLEFGDRRSILHSDKFARTLSSISERSSFRKLNHTRQIVGSIVNDDRVQAFILFAIVLNSILMGVATFPFVKHNPIVNSRFEAVDLIFLIIFTIESAMQLIFRGWTLLKDGFLVFDLTIVVLSWAMEGAQIARGFRIFRALRLISRIDTMKNLIVALISVIPNLTGICMLLSLVFYIFGVMFTQLYKDVSREAEVEEHYFVALPQTLFTLFQMMTLDGWPKVFHQAYEEFWWSWMLFVAFIIVSAFVFVNLIIAVICDAVHVLGDSNIAGLTGVGEDVIKLERSRDALECPNFSGMTMSTRQKLQSLEAQLDQIVLMQNELRAVVDTILKSNGS